MNPQLNQEMTDYIKTWGKGTSLSEKCQITCAAAGTSGAEHLLFLPAGWTPGLPSEEQSADRKEWPC